MICRTRCFEECVYVYLRVCQVVGVFLSLLVSHLYTLLSTYTPKTPTSAHPHTHSWYARARSHTHTHTIPRLCRPDTGSGFRWIFDFPILRLNSIVVENFKVRVERRFKNASCAGYLPPIFNVPPFTFKVLTNTVLLLGARGGESFRWWVLCHRC